MKEVPLQVLAPEQRDHLLRFVAAGDRLEHPAPIELLDHPAHARPEAAGAGLERCPPPQRVVEVPD
jgi:hypothetical protein